VRARTKQQALGNRREHKIEGDVAGEHKKKINRLGCTSASSGLCLIHHTNTRHVVLDPCVIDSLPFLETTCGTGISRRTAR